MCVNDSEAAVAFRQDIPSYNVPANILVSFKKAFSPLDKEAQEGAKPGRCLICGEEMPKYCVSHTVPRYCLKEIAVEGKLLTCAAVMGECHRQRGRRREGRDLQAGLQKMRH